MMNRRHSVLAMFAMGSAAEPLSAFAQQQANTPLRIGMVPDQVMGPWHKGFTDALRELGHIEGRDYVFIHSGVPYGPETELALDRVLEAKPDLILTYNLGYAVAAHKVTKTLPIVMMVSGFPVEGGVADSLTRPGRNVTGLTIYTGPEVFGKLVQLVHEVKPDARRIGVFMSYVPPFNPRAETDLINSGFRSAAERLKLDVRIFEIAKPGQVDDAMAWAGAQGVEALVLTGGVSVMPRMKDILRFAVAKRLPTIADSPWRYLGDSQPLLAYGVSFPTMYRQAAPYVHQILWKGVKPGELPIQLPARFEFIVNLKTARAIGLTVPPSMLVRADEVLE